MKRPLIVLSAVAGVTVLIAIVPGKFTLRWLIRKTWTWWMWIWIYFAFVPKAREKNRSRIGWFLIGATSLWGVALAWIMAALLVVKHLPWTITPEGYVTEFGTELARWLYPVGYSIGVLAMLLAARHLNKLPRLDQPR